MPAIPNAVRRGAVYYWRRRVPARLAESKRCATLLLGLRTCDPRRARVLAADITALADLCFFPAVMNLRLSQQQLQNIFRETFTRHLDKLEAVAARERMERDFNAEESRRSDKVTGWVYRLLETRGNRASVDDRSRASMLAEGMSEADIGEVVAMIAIMQQQNLANDPPARLKAMVEKVGGQANPLNLALAQEAVHRAMAEANFLTGRRYDGVRSESAAFIDDILAKRTLSRSRDMALAIQQAAANSMGPTSLSDDGFEAEPSKRAEPRTTAASSRVVVTARDVAPAGGGPDVAAPLDPEIASLPKASKRFPLEAHPLIVCGEKLVAQNRESWDRKTCKQARQIFRLFGKMLWEENVVHLEALEQRHFAQLMGLLAEVATSYGKSPKDEARSTRELRAIGASKPPAERGVKAGTLNRHLTFLGQLLVYLKGQGFKLDRDIDVTLLRAKTRNVRGRDKRARFSGEELSAIFHLPCFTGCAGWKGEQPFTSGPHVYHRALYFATILLYYTGARREEICGLMVDDVQSPELMVGDQRRRVPCIVIRENKARRIKNVQSMRLVALVPEVVRLGFLDYVQEIRALGYKLVFPDLKSPTSSSPMGDRLYDELKRGIDLVIPDASARKKVLHSFRKTFGDTLEQAGVAAEVRGDILGHGGETVTEEIYCDPIALSAMLKHLLNLPIVTGHLDYRSIELIPWVHQKRPPPFSRRGDRISRSQQPRCDSDGKMMLQRHS